MADRDRPTREVVHLIDTDEDRPNPGERVYALTLGGVLVTMVWTKDSHKDYHAWMPYPKVPKSVKDKLENLYNNGGWRTNGIEPEQASD